MLLSTIFQLYRSG